MRRALLLALLVAGCGSSPECEQVVPINGGLEGYEMTCIRECGVVLRIGAWVPGPSCEWERSVCRDRCADAGVP